MSGTRAEILAAQAEAEAARARIQETVARLKNRLSPRVRAQEAWDDVREKGEVLGEDALEFAYDRPRTVAAFAGVGVLLLVRRPLCRLLGRLAFWRRPKWDQPDQTIQINPARPPRRLPGKGGVKP